MHVSVSREMILGKFDDEDIGAVFQCGKCLPWDVTIDGSQGVQDQAFLSIDFCRVVGCQLLVGVIVQSVE